MSVDCPPQVASKPPTLSIRSRRARLLTSAAARLSPQTCFRLPHCFGRIRGLQRPRPPALRRADYRLPPVIVLPLWFFVFVVVVVLMSVMDFNQKGSASMGVVLLFVVLYHISKR